MSFSFYVAAPTPPAYQTLLDGLDYWDVHCEEGDREEEGPWPEGTLHFYRDDVSTRGVEVSLEEGRFQVRILTLASPEDYELALRFVESAAVLLKQPVSPEDGEPMPVERVRETYDADWIRATNESGAGVVRHLLREGEHEVMTLSGPHRPFHIGPRLLAELEADGPTEEFPDRLVGKMLEVQNIDPDEYYPANAMQAKPDPDEEGGFTFAVWGPGVPYLMPDVQFIALVRGEEEPPLFIPADRLPEVLPDGWAYLDERQILIEAVEEDEWEGVLERALPFREDPFAEAG